MESHRNPLKMPLNQAQLDILRLLSRNLDDSDLLAIKRLIVRYLADKVSKMVDEVWVEKKWTNEDMKRLLTTHERTPYNPKNE